MIDVVEQVIERHPKVKNEGIPEAGDAYRGAHGAAATRQSLRRPCPRQLLHAEVPRKRRPRSHG